MISWAIWAKNVDLNTKKQKRPPKSSKNKMFIFGLHSTSDDRSSDPSIKRWTKCKKLKKGPLSHWKIKCFWIMFNFWWSAEQSEQKTLTKMQKNKKGPLSHRKMKCSFLDYVQLLMIGWAIQAKNVDWNTRKQKRPPKTLKNKMFIFGLHSTSDDRLSDPTKNVDQNIKKQKGPLSYQKVKCSFLDYVQLLMIGWVIQAKNCQPKSKKIKKKAS